MPVRQKVLQVPLTELQQKALFAGLEARGWTWRDGFIYAPHATMWLSGSQPWVGDLREFHERMSGRLQRNTQAGWMYEEGADHWNLVADTKDLVDTLTAMLSALGCSNGGEP